MELRHPDLESVPIHPDARGYRIIAERLAAAHLNRKLSYKPDLVMIPIGGHCVMDPKDAAKATKIA